MNVAFSSAMPASLNAFTEREVLGDFMPLPCLGDGRVYPPQRDTLRPTYGKLCLLDISVWEKIHVLIFANPIPGENLPPGPFSRPCSMALR